MGKVGDDLRSYIRSVKCYFVDGRMIQVSAYLNCAAVLGEWQELVVPD